MNLDEFMSELQALDPAKLKPVSRASNAVRSMPEFARTALAPVPVEARTGGMMVFPYDSAPEAEETHQRKTRGPRVPLAATLALLVLMLMGGGAAAALFHDRIVMLLR